jgi:hypothetical protein
MTTQERTILTPELEASLSPEQRRIAELEALIAQKEAEAQAEKPDYPDTIHFLGSMTVHERFGASIGSATTIITEYGMELPVTPDLIAAAKDRFGHSWLDIVSDDEAQVRQWGQVMVRPGPWPEGKPRIEQGSQRWWQARDAQRSEAYTNIADEADLNQRLRQINAEFGIPTTSTHTKTYTV